jgi:hypothetical protein
MYMENETKLNETWNEMKQKTAWNETLLQKESQILWKFPR